MDVRVSEFMSLISVGILSNRIHHVSVYLCHLVSYSPSCRTVGKCPKNVVNSETGATHSVLRRSDFPLWIDGGDQDFYMTLDADDIPPKPIIIKLDNQERVLPDEATPGTGGEQKVSSNLSYYVNMCLEVY